MVTDFRNNERRRRKLLGGSGGMLPRKYLDFKSLKFPFLGFRVIQYNLTDFRKTVEAGMDPRLSAYSNKYGL